MPREDIPESPREADPLNLSPYLEDKPEAATKKEPVSDAAGDPAKPEEYLGDKSPAVHEEATAVVHEEQAAVAEVETTTTEVETASEPCGSDTGGGIGGE